MARLTASILDAEKSNLPAPAGRSIVLFGSVPNGQKITAGVKRKGVYVVNSISELNERASLGRNTDKSNIKQINSIIILACSGDDISAAPDIYKIASNINVLVTTIIIYKSCCIPISNLSVLSELRASSDMVVITSA